MWRFILRGSLILATSVRRLSGQVMLLDVTNIITIIKKIKYTDSFLFFRSVNAFKTHKSRNHKSLF